MKKLLFCLLILALLVIACQRFDNNASLNRDEMVPAVKLITETISGSHGVETKATISNDDTPAFAWNIGDNIAVHISNGKYVTTADEGASGASVAEATADFTVAYETGYSRDAFAIYPSTIVDADAAKYGQSGDSLDVTLPGSYSLAQISGETTLCPMIADNTGTNWTFYQLCGLLRLTVNSIPPSTKRLEINFNGKNVAGKFAIPNPVKGDGTSTIALENASGSNSSVITITNSGQTFYSGWGDGKVFNIPLPAGTYGDITVTAYNALSDGDAVLTMTRPFGYTADRLHATKRTASFPVFSINSSRSKRVIFAPGNLQATTTDYGANWTWRFAEHQYDFIGSGGGNTMINGNGTLSGENGTVDLFGWSTGKTVYGIHNSTTCNALGDNDYSGSFVDWGTIKTFGGITYPDNYWKTLSSNNSDSYELWYMMRTRETNATVNNIPHARFTMATINTDGTSVNGIILFPDYYEGPFVSTEDITWGSKINDYGKYSGWGGTTCTKAGWKTLEAFGCVFLPAAGTRVGVNVTFGESYYASSTNNNYPAACFHLLFSSNINPYNIYWNQTVYRYQGSSVRLAHEVQ